MVDAWELMYFGNINRDDTLDWDNNVLSDSIELEYDTHPRIVDGAEDWFTDWIEVSATTAPNDLQSLPSRAMPWLALLPED